MRRVILVTSFWRNVGFTYRLRRRMEERKEQADCRKRLWNLSYLCSNVYQIPAMCTVPW